MLGKTQMKEHTGGKAELLLSFEKAIPINVKNSYIL